MHNETNGERIMQGLLLETRPNLTLVGNNVVADALLFRVFDCHAFVGGGMEWSDKHSQNLPKPTLHKRHDTSQTASYRATATITHQLLKSLAFELRECQIVSLHT